MVSVAQVLTIMGLPAPQEITNPGEMVWKRGRGSLAEPCPELKTKPCTDRWMTEEDAATELETNHDGIISMIKSRKLRPAIHRGRIFISIESIRKKAGGEVPKPPPRPVWLNQMSVSEIPIEPDPEPELDTEIEDSLDDDRLEEREEFVPTKLTNKITNSQRWTTDCYNHFRRKLDPYVDRNLEIELVEYASGQFGYRIEDVAGAINKNPVVVRNFIAGHKVKADPTGRYVTQESLKAFIRKSRGIEIRDI